jgi:UDP-N-acetyl-D-mannosaminuronate dehydrogenase
MKQNNKVAVVGLGEVGRPLFDLISEHREAIGVDITPVERIEPVEVLHICFPFEISDFVGETARYIEMFQPALTIIHSTVAVGTTRTVAQRTGATVVNSPIRGKHARMLDELRMYVKFIGAMDPTAAEKASQHFASLGLKTKILSSPEATELAKLTETTYFGVLIAWAQTVERYCDLSNEKYDEVVSFYEEIKYLPPVKFHSGVIGGHCVMPNIQILRQLEQLPLVEAIRVSNQMKMNRETHASEVMNAR